VTAKYRRCPACDKNGWYAPKKARPGLRRCRFCKHDNGVLLAARTLHRTLDRGKQRVKKALEDRS